MLKSTLTEVDVYCTAQSSKKQGNAWSAVLVCGKNTKIMFQKLDKHTKEQMELIGVIAALFKLNQSCRVKVHTTSGLLVGVMTHQCDRPEKDMHLWKSLTALEEKHAISWVLCDPKSSSFMTTCEYAIKEMLARPDSPYAENVEHLPSPTESTAS